MRCGLIAAAQAPSLPRSASRQSAVLSIYSQCNQSLKSPDRECAVQYLYLYMYGCSSSEMLAVT